MTCSRKITAITALSVFAVFTITASTGFSSGHQQSEVLRVDAPAVDWLITGANKGSLKLKNLPASAVDKGECPLSFHHDMMKKKAKELQGEELQPFPGD